MIIKGSVGLDSNINIFYSSLEKYVNSIQIEAA